MRLVPAGAQAQAGNLVLESHFGFRYFRFDGAHRISCMYMLGIRQIPCMVFSVRSKT